MCATRPSCRVVVLGLLTLVWFTDNVLADHLPPVDPIRRNEDHSHENHAGHRSSNYGTQGADLSFTNFSDADFATGLERVDLTGAVFDRASLAGMNATDAVFMNSSFRDVKWPRATIMDTTVAATDFTGSNLSGSDIQNAIFHQVVMRNVDLSLGYFRNVEFNDTDLRGANLSGAYFREGSLSDAIVDATTTFDRSTRFPAGYDPRLSGMTETAPRHPDAIRGLVAGFVLPDGAPWTGIAYEASSDSLLLADGTNSVSRYSTRGEFLDSTYTPWSVFGIEVMPNGDWLIAATDEEDRLAVYTPATNEVVSDVFFDTHEFEELAFDSNRGTVFIMLDDGGFAEVTLDGIYVKIRFTAWEHESIGFDSQTNQLIVLYHHLDTLSENGDIVKSVSIHEPRHLYRPQSISVDAENRLLYAIYNTDYGDPATVRVFDLTAIPEPSSACLAIMALLALLHVRRKRAR